MAVVQGKIYRIKSHAGEGLCLRLASGTQTVAAHKLLQTATESTTNMGQRWVVKNISGRKIVSAIDNSYALNFDTTDTTRKAEIYQYSNSDANTSLEFEKVDLSNNIYKIKITISGTTYYLTAGSKTSTAYATWEPASGGDNQKWMFEEIVTIDLPTNRTYNWNQFYTGITSIVGTAGCGWACALDVANIYGPDAYEPTDMPSNSWGSNGVVWSNLPEHCNAIISNSYTYYSTSEINNALSAIRSEIDNNHPVIIRLYNANIVEFPLHFVVAFGYINNGTTKSDILVFDPGVSTEEESEDQKNGTVWSLAEAENLVSKWLVAILTTSGR